MYIGQNGIWGALTSMIDGSKIAWSGGIDGWDSEKNHFTFGVGADPAGSVVGHYTQVMTLTLILGQRSNHNSLT